MNYVISVKKDSNIYDILDCFEDHEIQFLDCNESNFSFATSSITAKVNKVRIRIKGAKAPRKEFPNHLTPIVNSMKVLNIDQSAAVRWDQMNMEEFPNLEEINYFFHKGYCHQE